MKRSSATRTSSPHIVMQPAPTAFFSFSILIQPRTAFRSPKLRSITRCALRPDSAEAHFARGDYYFRCLRDYDRAQEELAIARPSLPNSTPFFILSGYINRRRNHFHEAERDFSTAFALDPRNPNAYNLLADTYVLQRRFPEAVHVYDNVLAAGEQAPIVRARRAASMLYGTCDTGL